MDQTAIPDICLIPLNNRCYFVKYNSYLCNVKNTEHRLVSFSYVTVDIFATAFGHTDLYNLLWQKHTLTKCKTETWITSKPPMKATFM